MESCLSVLWTFVRHRGRPEMKELFCKVCGTRIITIGIIFLQVFFSDSSCKIDRIRQEVHYQCIIPGNKGEYTAQIEGEWKTEFDMN